MTKRYLKPSVAVAEISIEHHLMAGSNTITDRTGIDNGFGWGGQSDGSVEINAKNNKYDIWGLDEDEN